MAVLSAISGRRPGRAAARATVVAVLLALALLAPPGAGAAVPAPAALPEYQIKAVFLFNFAQFVTWPAEAFHDAEAPLVIGVLGTDPFGRQLEDAVRGEKIGPRALVVRHFSRVDEITECHILFISSSEAGHLQNVLARLKGRSLLTVGDVADFNRAGGMVRFITENHKIRLRINVAAAKGAALIISSKLLRPALIFNPGQD